MKHFSHGSCEVAMVFEMLGKSREISSMCPPVGVNIVEFSCVRSPACKK